MDDDTIQANEQVKDIVLESSVLDLRDDTECPFVSNCELNQNKRGVGPSCHYTIISKWANWMEP